MIPVFNTPVVMDKELEMGSDKYARIVVWATVNEQENVNNIKELKIVPVILSLTRKEMKFHLLPIQKRMLHSSWVII